MKYIALKSFILKTQKGDFTFKAGQKVNVTDDAAKKLIASRRIAPVHEGENRKGIGEHELEERMAIMGENTSLIRASL
ncbi:MAG: hypothetical protein MRJ65_15540 [Candidatus Brocadiaceae bacterium]|nr:hypothetical protein [Candidatus Brocadiaceae bacterium]